MSDARTESILLGSISAWVSAEAPDGDVSPTPDFKPRKLHAICNVICSNGPINSILDSVPHCMTGRTHRAACENRYNPGKGDEFVGP